MEKTKRLLRTKGLKQDLINNLFSYVPGGVSIATDPSCKEILHNPIAAEFLGIEPWQSLSHSALELPPVKIYSNGAELTAEQMPMQRAGLGEIVVNQELVFVWPDGVSKTGLWSTKPIKATDGTIVGVIATMEDITSRRQIEEELKASEDRYRSLFENSIDAILLTSPNGEIHYVNPATCTMFQWTEEELYKIGRQGIIDPSDPSLYTIINEREAYGKTRHELTMVRKDGTKFPTVVSSSFFKDSHGQDRATTIIHDITQLKQVETNLRLAKEEAERLATFDELTGSLNRRAFLNRLSEEVSRAKRQKTPIGLILLDIDLFKLVNDTYGHLVGDFVLQEFNRCITQTLRSYDFFGRYGGEEFVVCLPNTNLPQAANIAERMRREVEQLEIIVNNSQKISVTASFGVAHFEHDSQESMDSFVSRADDAMYQAKSARNCVRLKN